MTRPPKRAWLENNLGILRVVSGEYEVLDVEGRVVGGVRAAMRPGPSPSRCWRGYVADDPDSGRWSMTRRCESLQEAVALVREQAAVVGVVPKENKRV